MKAYLKYGGLGMSALLTIALFIGLFGDGAYGLVLAGAALALFEGGAIAWNKLLDEAKNEQRPIAKLGMWYSVLTSIASSGAQIILSTGLWKPPFDLAFVTLCIIVGALAVNVVGIIMFEMAHPSTQAKHRELDRQAKAQRETERLQDQVIEQSLIKAEAEVSMVAGQVSGKLAGHMRDQVTAYLLARTIQDVPVPILATGTVFDPASTRHDAEVPASPILASTEGDGPKEAPSQRKR